MKPWPYHTHTHTRAVPQTHSDWTNQDPERPLAPPGHLEHLLHGHSQSEQRFWTDRRDNKIMLMNQWELRDLVSLSLADTNKQEQSQDQSVNWSTMMWNIIMRAFYYLRYSWIGELSVAAFKNVNTRWRQSVSVTYSAASAAARCRWEYKSLTERQACGGSVRDSGWGFD